MRNIIKLLFILFISISSFAQEYDTEIYLKNGDILYGLGKLSKNNEVLFKLKDQKKFFSYSFDRIDYVIMQIGADMRKLYCMPVAKKKKKVVVQELIKGKVSYYRTIKNKRVMYNGDLSTLHNRDIYTYYLKKEGDKALTKFGKQSDNIILQTGIKKVGLEFFSDCPSLVEKIASRYFTMHNLRAAVQYYNENCGIK